jgi:hypothetical protein
LARPADLVIDSSAHAWFSVSAYRYLGIGTVDLASGAAKTYPFPYIDRPGQHNTKPNTCPSGAFHCIPPDAIAGVDVKAIEIGPNGIVLVFTDTSGVAPELMNVPAAVYEFRPPA